MLSLTADHIQPVFRSSGLDIKRPLEALGTLGLVRRLAISIVAL
jgi:hypothetical protein